MVPTGCLSLLWPSGLASTTFPAPGTPPRAPPDDLLIYHVSSQCRRPSLANPGWVTASSELPQSLGCRRHELRQWGIAWVHLIRSLEGELGQGRRRLPTSILLTPDGHRPPQGSVLRCFWGPECQAWLDHSLYLPPLPIFLPQSLEEHFSLTVKILSSGAPGFLHRLNTQLRLRS